MTTAAAIERLKEGAAGILGRPLAAGEVGQFSKYLELLTKWNKIHRLVGSTAPVWMVDNLLLDSLLFLRVLPERLQSAMDLGAGAGLPGIPIKITRPDLRLTLVESRRRRASFLLAAIRELALTETRVLNARAEEVAQELAASFEVVVMRCAGRPDAALHLAEKFLIAGGLAVAAGPPRTYPLQHARWVTVPGIAAGTVRRFALLTSSEG